MNISDDFIQSNPNITSHTIIEIHPQQYERALEWAKDKPNVEIILGDWMDILPLENRKFDGILFDTDTDSNLPFFMPQTILKSVLTLNLSTLFLLIKMYKIFTIQRCN